ncbi:hypothetical protein BGX34_007046 [Mortierella sp. NVP85]|nr:hypothetical protein BGX34_007046 [Mortierella sp. NVP85]
MPPDNAIAHQGVHLVILHHGLWGNVGHVRFIAEQFKQRLGDRILVYRAQANESGFTYDGVDVCGQRLVQEIYNVIKVIEDGGNVEEMKGQKSKWQKGDAKAKKAPSNDLDAEATNTTTKVTQLSYLGYSLGGLIGRFAIGMLEIDGFFDPVEQGGRGIEPMYFVTMATPHLGTRQPSRSRWSRAFNYLCARMLSRTGEQLQLVDNYIGGKPILLVMSEPSSVFIRALTRFKRRSVYCNIRNDRSVPFWTASFSDADPFKDLNSMEIQYNSGYSSLIESFEQQDLDDVSRRKREREEALKSASLKVRIAHRLKAIPWKKYAIFGLFGPFLLPIWLVVVSSTISVQGLNSRRRIRPIIRFNEELQRMRDETVIMRISTIADHSETSATRQEGQPEEDEDQPRDRHYEDPTIQSIVHVHSVPQDTPTESSVTLTPPEPSTSPIKGTKPASLSYPHLKTIRQLSLLPVQIEMSKNLNQLKWRKNIIHIEALNAHASIVVRESRFSHHGGVAAVQHAVDMFKDDGEDE